MKAPFEDPQRPGAVLHIEMDADEPLSDSEVRALIERQTQLTILMLQYDTERSRISRRLLSSGEAKLRAQRKAEGK